MVKPTSHIHNHDNKQEKGSCKCTEKCKCNGINIDLKEINKDVTKIEKEIEEAGELRFSSGASNSVDSDDDLSSYEGTFQDSNSSKDDSGDLSNITESTRLNGTGDNTTPRERSRFNSTSSENNTHFGKERNRFNSSSSQKSSHLMGQGGRNMQYFDLPQTDGHGKHIPSAKIIEDGRTICTMQIPPGDYRDRSIYQVEKDGKLHELQIVIESEEPKKNFMTRCQPYICLSILLFANLLNYVDRFTIAGVLMDVKNYYKLTNTQAGLLQTSFIIFYMLFSPLFGFLGDRMSRKYLMAVGIAFWSIVTLAGSFVPAHLYPLFLAMRAMVGIGEASYSTLAPTIIADLFVKDMRSKVLSIFYFAIPVGSGLGYIIGSNVANAIGHWQWALRVTPPFGILCVILILVLVQEPPRGLAEGGSHLKNTSYWEDIRYLFRNRSFIFSSLGFTCVAFVAGAVSLWFPLFMQYSIRVQGVPASESQVSLYFGLITCAAGFIGVGVGSESARRLRHYNKRADPLVCAFGLISCTPFLFFAVYMANKSTIATWFLCFVGETLLCLNWAIVTDMLLYVVIPTRRSTAEAVQILMSHLFGDAGSPYLIGLVSDSITAGSTTNLAKYMGLHYSLYICCFASVLGGGFFLATALFIQQDREKAEKIIKDSNKINTEILPADDYPTPSDSNTSISTDDRHAVIA